MTDVPFTLEFPGPCDIVDIEHPDRLDWRRCRISIQENRDRSSMNVHVKLREKKAGRDSHDLFEGAFRYAIDAALLPVFRTLPGFDKPGQLEVGYLSRAGTRGYSKGEGSATLTFSLIPTIREALLALSAHETLRLLAQARKVAEDQARRRRASPG